jgi:predicted transcriptional regulator with HTH domain
MSTRRAKNRERLLILLSSWGEAHSNRLAISLGVPASRIKWMMHGKRPHYSPELSLVELGLAQDVPTSRARVYRITDLGRRKARSITSSWVRAREREAILRAAKGTGDGQVDPTKGVQVTVT